jgi:hypothetical protein
MADPQRRHPSEREYLIREGNLQQMDVMAERRRKRLILIMIVTIAFLAMIFYLIDFSLHLARKRGSIEMDPAAQALTRLNQHISKQSRKIKAGCESTLLLMRHCEKIGPYVLDKEGNEHCSYIGYERARYLATLFGPGPDTRWPNPAHLFALTVERGGHQNFREWETLLPLSKQSGIITDLSESPEALADEYFDMLRAGTLCGQVAVVSWKHEYIPDVARALGCGSDNGCPDQFPDNSFDQVWQLKYVFHPEDISSTEDENGVVPTPPARGDGDDEEDDVGNGNEEPAGDDEEDVPAGEEGEDGDTDKDSVDDQNNRRRLTQKIQVSHKHGWNIYATVTYQRFDPLAFSKQSGDYPSNGASRGGRWREQGDL